MLVVVNYLMMPRITEASKPPASDETPRPTEQGGKPARSAFLWVALFVLFLNSSWAVYHFQFESLPSPLDAEQAGKRGFSEVSALEHVKYLTKLGPHPVGSDALELAVQYVFAAAEKIQKTAHWEVDVQVDLFRAETAANHLSKGLFKGKTLVYSDLKHVVLRILPKYLPEAEDNAILVSSHIDTVFSSQGAGDCSSCVGVMVELARGISQWAHGFKNGVIFLFNTGEEEGLNGAHSFITQHPWRSTIRFVVDLEAMGIGGKSSVFQGGSVPWAIETYAKVSKYPSGLVIAQDLFHSGAIQSATDFQVYEEVGGLSGLDFAYTDATAIYHTKNDKLKLLKPGSLQHLGENMLAFLIQSAMSTNLQNKMEVKKDDIVQSQSIFFDILGTYMVVYSQRLATMLHNSVILQSLLIWTTSLIMGGYHGAMTFGLSCFSILLMWICSLSLSIMVSFLIPLISTSPVPYIANPWLVIGLFGAPAVLGALTGQHLGFLCINRYLRSTFSKRAPTVASNTLENLIKLETERCLFKADGLMEATLSPLRSPKQLKIVTLILGLAMPILFSSGMMIRLVGILVGIIVRSERNPGSRPEWLGNVIVAVFVSAIVCLMLVYLLSYIHLSGAKGPMILSMLMLLALALAAVSTGVLPTFTEDISRAVNVVHVVETKGNSENEDASSFISLFSLTPGKLTEEVKNLKDEEFTCGRNKTIDFVSFTVKYGCWSSKDSGSGWSKSDIPIVHVEHDSIASGARKTGIFIDTKFSKRWSLAINREEIRDFTFEADSEELVPLGDKSEVDGWHFIQFSGGKNSPTKFHLNLVWLSNTTHQSQKSYESGASPLLLKLRTDVSKITPEVESVLEKLPPWCSLFGKSTSPYLLAFVTTLPVQF
ncbi:Peptidase family M28 [Musa troglodytarum]|uniref:Vacuolar membrane protease n=1 Tax=Musa troglodytarum TaxID=320322 RepID=A0A9E7G916_9LILI|nr:Peptidase family M28 [Musa troglodytarum]